ncbi:hypothetical protein KSP40_PGU021348 [Platanthera guangdongensis]|uniref:Probable magnesium transporter n=1 Tax=Platanthera guangdongensis TaxID=2320717 RepID=A0ABR2N3C2_9ASPA
MSGHDFNPYWRMVLPFSYAIVSGAIGSCSVLFAKSLSNMLRLTMSSNYHLHSLFTYSLLLLFFSTAGFWMARLNEGLSLFDAILIVPMFQIAWTFFSICTGLTLLQATCLSEETINASSVIVMPMVSSRTTGFRGTIFDRAKFIPLRTAGWSEPTSVEDDSYEADDSERRVRVSLLS